ncbi:MAG: sodium/solute symporter [Planctomycetes bacterium]|nr:sodium/solute symporter [Planctomycetota bacterium]
MRLPAIILFAASSLALAGEAAAERPLIDPAPFKKAIEDHVEAKLREALGQELVEGRPETPMQIEVRSFHELQPRGMKAVAQAVVAVKGDKAGETRLLEAEFELKDGKWEVTKLGIPPHGFGALNYAVIALYLLGMVAIGWWTSRRIGGTRAFFIADGRMNFLVVGVSIMTTYLSALTMMALSGLSFGPSDFTWTVQLPFLVLTGLVITGFVLPRYRAAGVISVYQFLEQRIHVSARLLASVAFIVFSIGRMGIVLFLPALAFHIITGFDLFWAIVISGAVVTLYTVIGGMEAVIWTDFAQAIVMVGGAALTVAYVLLRTGADFGPVAAQYHKLRIWEPGLDLTKVVTVWLILQTIFETVRIYGTQQDMTQRYMTTPSTRRANQSVWIGILMYIPLGYCFYFVGSALFVYYKVHPDPTVPALVANGRSDAIYPYFTASQLPPGLAGLVIAAIFAAAMSSIDACMNSSSTVCIEDFYRRFSRVEREDRHNLRVAQWLTLLWGVLATLMALWFMDIRQAQVVWSKIMSTCTNGVLALMALAFLPWRVSKWAAIAGFVACYLALFTMMWFLQVKPHLALTYPLPKDSGINYLLWPVIGNLVCFGVALAADALLRPCAGKRAG